MKKIKSFESELIRKQKAVKNIALRKGNPVYIAEDIAQEAVLNILEKPKKLFRNDMFCYVDVVREGPERKYTREGRTPVNPIYESELKNLDFKEILKIIPSSDIENEDWPDYSEKVNKLTSKLICLPPRSVKILICYFLYGLTLKDIGRFNGISQSRVQHIVIHALQFIKRSIR